MWVKANICILCSYRHGNNFRLSMHMHTRTGEKPFICSICSKRNTMVHGCMAVWIHGKKDSWQFGFVAKRMNSSLYSWHNGCIAVWIHGTMDVWQFGCMTFSKTSPPHHLRSSKIKTHYVRSSSFTVNAQKLKTPKLSGD